MTEDMRGLFFLVKGQYRKGIEPVVMNKVSGEPQSVECYDPSRETTENWYMLMDKTTFHCVSCGGDPNKVIHGVYTQIVKHKGSAKNYFKYVCRVTSEDYYEVHYLGHKPLTPEQRSKKAEGRCPRVSPIMQEHYSLIYQYYGDYFEEQIKRLEDEAYEEVRASNSPLARTNKILKKSGGIKKKPTVLKKSTPQVIETAPKKVALKPVASKKPVGNLVKPKPRKVKMLGR